MAWSFDAHTPVYLQIANRLRNDVLSGAYKEDEQIPTVRQLALTAAVNPNTVQRALTELETEGILYSKGTQGRFVTGNPDILLAARKKAAEDLVSEFLKKAESLSITRDELIDMLGRDTDK